MSVTDRILSALTTVIRMNDKVEEMAALMRQQQLRIDDLNGRVIRLETVLELALSQQRSSYSAAPGLPDTHNTPQHPPTA
jgi:hypothetical protein